MSRKVTTRDGGTHESCIALTAFFLQWSGYPRSLVMPFTYLIQNILPKIYINNIALPENVELRLE